MYYNVSSWKKLEHGLYQNGATLVLIKPKFFTTHFAIVTGAIIIALGVINGYPEFSQPQSTDFIIPAVAAVAGLCLVFLGRQGVMLRKHHGGIHPTDTVFTIDPEHNTLRRRIGDTEEQVAPFDQVKLETYRNRSGKHTSYHVRIVWPGGFQNLLSASSMQAAEERLADLRQRLGLAPTQPPTQA